MRIKSLSLLAGLVLLGVAYPVGRTLGQAVYGSIIGTVTDSSGAAVPNAKVTITNVDKGVSVTTASNESGNYEQQHLIVGTYEHEDRLLMELDVARAIDDTTPSGIDVEVEDR